MTKDTNNQKVQEIFAPLEARLFEIVNRPRELTTDLSGKIVNDLIIPLFGISIEDSLAYTIIYVEKIESVINKMPEIEQVILDDYKLIGNYELTPGDLHFPSQIEYMKELKMDAIKDELVNYLNLLNSVQNQIEGNMQLFGSHNNPLNRLKFNLSLSELCGLVRLLFEGELLLNVKQEDLKTIISEHFESKKGGTSIKNISNKLSPNEIPFDSLEKILKSLIKKLSELKEIY